LVSLTILSRIHHKLPNVPKLSKPANMGQDAGQVSRVLDDLSMGLFATLDKVLGLTNGVNQGVPTRFNGLGNRVISPTLPVVKQALGDFPGIA
jgi:hypothetical protein